MTRWGRDDPTAAAAWLASLAEGASRQAAISKFVDSAASLEPQLAWTYAMTLTDPQKQIFTAYGANTNSWKKK